MITLKLAELWKTIYSPGLYKVFYYSVLTVLYKTTSGLLFAFRIVNIKFSVVKQYLQYRHQCIVTLFLGFPFYVKKLFTRNIVTDVTDGYYIVITVVTT
jgi:hypothetical protein